MIKKISSLFSRIYNKRLFTKIIILFHISLALFFFFSHTVFLIFYILLLLAVITGLCYKSGRYFRQGHPLYRILVLALLTGIFVLILDTMMRSSALPGGIIYSLLLNYLFLALFTLVFMLIRVIAVSAAAYIKRRPEAIKSVLTATFLLVTFFLFYPPAKIAHDAPLFYHRTINPKAGVIYYEKQYRATTEKAEKYRSQINDYQDELETKSKKPPKNLTNEIILAELKKRQAIIDPLLKEREQALREIISIDQAGLSIHLTDDQKKFYEMRLKADNNELTAFYDFKLAQQRYITGMYTHYKFWDRFFNAVDSSFSDDEALRNPVNLAALEKEINDFYNKDVKRARDEKILSTDLLKKIDRGFSVVNELFGYMKFLQTKPSKEEIKARDTKLVQAIQEGGKEADASELVTEWVDTYVYPGMYLQDKVHQQSFAMFKSAYEYAKKHKMDVVFTVWNKDYPGYEDPQPVKETMATSKEMKENYYKQYQNPKVIYIRTALNAYLAGNTAHSIPEMATKKDKDEDYIYGLDSFDKSYYKSKFVIIYFDPAPLGGDYITLLFQDRPDRFFTTWIYQNLDRSYEMRQFWSSAKDNKSDIDNIDPELKKIMFDKEHAL